MSGRVRVPRRAGAKCEAGASCWEQEALQERSGAFIPSLGLAESEEGRLPRPPLALRLAGGCCRSLPAQSSSAYLEENQAWNWNSL